jgi:hypothetical protein
MRHWFKRKSCQTGFSMVLLCASLALPLPLSASGGLVEFEIPRQPLGTALLAFSEQAGLQVLIATPLTRNRMSVEISGRYEPSAALRRLLGSDRLRFRYVSPKTIAISGASAPDGEHHDLRNGGPDPRLWRSHRRYSLQ